MRLCICLYFIILIILYRKKNLKQPIIPFSIENTNTLKGLLAISIIIHHFSRSIHPTPMSPFSLFTDIGTIMVGGFLFISGYGLTHSYLRNKRNYLSTFLSRRLKKILLPFFLSTIIYQTLQFILTSKFNFQIILHDILKGETTHLLPHSWYIFMITYFYISYYYTIRTQLEPYKKISIITILILIYVYATYSFKWGAYWYLSTPLFIIGIIYKIKEERIGRLIHEKLWILYTTIISVAFLCYPLGPIFRITILTLFITTPFLQFKIMSRATTFLGKISYEMYLLQGVAFYMYRNNILYIENNYAYLTICLATIIIMAYIQHLVTNNALSLFSKQKKYV